MSDREARPKGYTENKCPTCRGRGERYSGGLLGSGWVKCERCDGSGRINTSGGEEARAALDALKPEKPPWLGGPVKGAKADPQCPDGYPYEAERQVIAAEKALKPQPIQTYTASHTGPLGVSSEAEKDESALAPENVEWNNPGRLRQGVKDALAIERQVRLGRMDEDYELAPAAAYRKLYAEYRRLQAERDKYLEWFQKADAELERLHFENEQRESGRSPVDSGTGCEKHGRTDCEDCYLDALAPGTGTDEKDIYSLVKAAEKTLEMLDAVGYEDKYHGKGELDRRDDRRWEHVSEQSRVVYRRGIRAALLAALTDSEGRHE